MVRTLRSLAVVVAVLGLVVVSGSTFGAPKENKQNPHQQGGDKPSKQGQHKHVSGKDLLGDKIKTNGKHKLEDHGKFSAIANVSNGKITGVNVKHAEKGDVPVTKYKTNQKMAQRPTSGIMLASRFLAQSQYIGTMWIGYGYIDDYGEEVIYWFPYDMIYDGDTGAIDYIPA
jgi:hypothetical protein